MKLREAVFDDWEILLNWRNDPITRNNSFTQESVSKETHIMWFKNSLSSPDRKIYILENQSKEPLGTIRFDKTQNKTYILSWNISPNHRQKGYGTLLLNLALKDKRGTFIAEIKPENKASIKMVEKNGFTKLTDTQYTKMVKRTDKEIIDEIEAIRTRNNVNWMDAVRLAFELAPERARAIFQDIKECDAKVNELLEELATND
jgi:RimJ/RimL family protein N-acetyltransferase